MLRKSVFFSQKHTRPLNKAGQFKDFQVPLTTPRPLPGPGKEWFLAFTYSKVLCMLVQYLAPLQFSIVFDS